MKLLEFLWSALAPQSLLEQVSSKGSRMNIPERIPYDINQYALYEAYLPLEAIIFYIGAFAPSDRAVNSIVANVLKAKKQLEKSSSSLLLLQNFSKTISSPGEIGALIKLRNQLLSGDKSYIMEGQTRRNIARILKRLRKTEEDGSNEGSSNNSSSNSGDSAGDSNNGDKIRIAEFEPCDQDSEYKLMIKRLREAVYENENIGKAMAEERREFYRKREERTPEEILKAKVSISLGGFLIRPNSLFRLIRLIRVDNKEVRVRGWMHQIMSAVEDLELKTGTKTAFKKKLMIRELLQGLLDGKNRSLDQVLEARSEILQLALRERKAIEKENMEQEQYIRNLIRVIENMREEQWIVRYNKDIADDYVKFLLSGLPSYKRDLLSHF